MAVMRCSPCWTDRTAVRLRDAEYCSTRSGLRSGSILGGVSVTFSTSHGRASGDPGRDPAARGRGPQPRQGAGRRRAPVRRARARCVSMDAVAAEAGVGKGTLFRGFGDRAGLVHGAADRAGAPPPGGRHPRPGAARPGRAARRAPDRLRRAPVRALRPARRADRRRRAGRHPLPDGAVRLLPPARARCWCRRPRPARTGSTSPTPCWPPCAWTTSATSQTVREMSDERIAAGWADLVRRLCG